MKNVLLQAICKAVQKPILLPLNRLPSLILEDNSPFSVLESPFVD